MKRSAKCLFAACLATMVAAAGAAPTQDLVNVRAAGQITASWTRQPDFYALQVVMETSKRGPPGVSAPAHQIESQLPPGVTSISAEEIRQLGIVNVADALKNLVPQNAPGKPMPNVVGDVSLDRSSFFIGNTIANLRGLDPTFGCRTLTLVDGRRVVGGEAATHANSATAAAAPAPSPSPAPLVQPYPPRIKHPRIEAWLLRADGTQILPAAYTCALVPAVQGAPTSPPSASRSRAEEFTYRYSISDSTQAVAAAIRIDNDFYIEKLQPLESRPSGQ